MISNHDNLLPYKCCFGGIPGFRAAWPLAKRGRRPTEKVERGRGISRATANDWRVSRLFVAFKAASRLGGNDISESQTQNCHARPRVRAKRGPRINSGGHP